MAALSSQLGVSSWQVSRPTTTTPICGVPLGLATPAYKRSCSRVAAYAPGFSLSHTPVRPGGASPEQVLDTSSPSPSSPWKDFLSGLARAATLLGLAVALALSNSPEALAARSGGRVGGSSGFSRAASSASRSTGGGWGGSTSSSSGSSWGSRSVAARSTTTHHHTTVVTPGFGFGWGVPMYSPFGYGGGGMAVGYNPVFGAVRSLVAIMLLSMLVITAVNVYNATQRRGQGAMVAEGSDEDVEDEEAVVPVSVAKLQVCLLGVARDLKDELDVLGASANTSTTQGLHMLLQETVLALLRNPAYWVFADTSSQTLRSARQAERAFGSMALQERSHVQEETLINTEGRGIKTRALAKDSENVSELMVVTILVAAEGRWSLPPIKSSADLRAALTRLGGVTPNNVMAVELMWTPQADNDSLTQQEVMVEYPNLVPV